MIVPGSILMEKDALHPSCFEVQDESFPMGWTAVTHKFSFHDFETELSTTGWTFFYMANQITATALAFNRKKAIDSALEGLIKDVRRRRCNCLEIDTVDTRSFLRMHYVTMSAHPRHIQKGMVFAGEPDHVGLSPVR